ncbi:MAG TPA: group I intron-associated PD-(D/E)XK endonuclease [Candidatus Aquilonibacter sp.]|nr:group I intron-associated PD-(D/E)XK endonuclease [Candidatus Aquilonibacter sp.]
MDDRISFLRDTKRIGDIAEMRIMAACAEAGYHVLVPFGENRRYDIVLERDGRFFRVQVKAGRLRNGSLIFNAYSAHSHRNGMANRRYDGEIDYFGVWCGDDRTAYLIPVSDVGVVGCFRVLPTRNGQRRRVRWALNYLLEGREGKVVGQTAVDGVSLGSLLPS